MIVHAEVKNFEEKVAARNKSDFEKRVEKIDAGINLAVKQYEEGSKAVLENGMNAAYAPFYEFVTADEKTQDDLIVHYTKKCEAKQLPITKGKTTFSHMVVMLVFGRINTSSKSQRARLLRKAAGIDGDKKKEGVEPKGFLHWLKQEGGIVKALGGNQPGSYQSSDAKREEYINNAVQRLASQSNKGTVTGIAADGLQGVTESRFVAILEKDGSGKIVVRAFVQADTALHAAYAAYGKSISK